MSGNRATKMASTKLIQDFEHLRDYCIVIRQNYNTYIQLFNEENRDILSKVAATFFTDIATIMQRDWVLQVCKIMDKAVIYGQENLTIDLINKQLRDQSLSNSVIDRISDEILIYYSKLKPVRNKRLAHNDRNSQVNSIVLGETTESELNVFLVNIQKYCDEVGSAIGIGPLDFSCSGCKGDVLDLLKHLRTNEATDGRC